MDELTWIDPATGRPHRADHICNHQCWELKEQARERKKAMDLQEALTRLGDADPYKFGGRDVVTVYKSDLDAALDRLEKLEEKLAGSVDVTSDIKVGDTVVSLISYMEVEPGTEGKVIAIRPEGKYSIEVEFEGMKFLYLRNGVLGFNRNELGKVGG